ncbi:tRNA (N6-threonylcarbamoyladenosine(37)-N6)-methyltransferase TrmO [Paraferrimonas sp. SM1919]|uniref:tRNA (N6-threonylcarbamoyladenosine(37)-N6)-methyltransferase TrmO n=1 Tax=Paraferrimonas sp. SM1919 TaxID=2662263 RepID=UPI0013D61D75|nr:tRNA (N6-threonylcarbamoyladenosine(37)-N6)-methyltransferase TrmO [Paraferrimonas sp. SM1919]
MTNNHAIEAVAICRSPYKQKFAIPRQPGLADVTMTIELQPPFDDPTTLMGLEQYSHVWLLFLFHQNLDGGWQPSVRPPRLGGNKRMGVFATRATFRPNGIGQSAVKLVSVNTDSKPFSITVAGADLLDGTPIIDIKPYIPYSDAIVDADGGMAQQAPELKPVKFTPQALLQLSDANLALAKDAKKVITEVLAQDPRPAYKRAKTDEKRYQVLLYNIDIRWYVDDNTIIVEDIEKVGD